MGLHIESLSVLLLVAGLVAMIARRIKLPYTVALVLAGCGLAWFPFRFTFSLTQDLVFTALLPPLIFEAAFHVEWREFRKQITLLLTLATVGVLLSAGVVALGVYYLLHWQWGIGLVVGVLLSATDTVSVLATFKQIGVKGRLLLLVEGESLLNDGTAAVLFSMALALLRGDAFHMGSAFATFLATVVGGAVCGGLVAGTVLGLAGETEDPLIEITFTTVAAYGAFLFAEYFHMSGVIATMTAGLMIGNIGSLGAITDRGREATSAFWEYACFVSNSLIFLLMGVHLSKQSFAGALYPAIVIFLLLILGRALGVYLCCGLFRRGELRVERKQQHMLFWGGLRGALALALVLGLPDNFPQRSEILNVMFLVVAFSLGLQGLTVPSLLRRLKLSPLQPE